MTLAERLRAAIQPSECLTSVVSNDLLIEAANQIEHAVIPNMRIETMETETKFTPGPWRVYDGPYGYQHRIISDHDMVGDVCDVRRSRDARLIAAAPMLFEACQTFALWLHREETGYLQNWGERRATAEGEREWDEWYMENLNLCDLAQTQARAALAAARGTKE